MPSREAHLVGMKSRTFIFIGFFWRLRGARRSIGELFLLPTQELKKRSISAHDR
jgi:hypothetical protein